MDASQVLSGLPVSLVNAFNLNDGPPPYTALVAEFILDNQQALYNLEVTDVPPAPYQMSGEIQPTLMLLYRDGTDAARSKFINFTVAVNQSFPRTTTPIDFEFFISVQSGTVTDLSASGNSLTFTADMALNILGFNNQPQHFAVLPDFTCAAPPSGYPTACVDMIGLHSVCNIESGAFLSGVIPFQRVGTPPYHSASVEILPILPNVLFAGNSLEGIDLQLAFPVVLRFFDINNVAFEQNAFIIGPLSLIGPTLDAGEVVFADLRITSTSPPFYTGTAFVVNVVNIAGSITVMRSHAAQTLVTPLVSCGPFPVDGICVQAGGVITETIPSL